MRERFEWGRIRAGLVLVLLTGALALAVSACGGDDDGEPAAAAETAAETTAAATEAAEPAASEAAETGEAAAADVDAQARAAANALQKPGECGLGTGEPATGEPIKVGVIVTKQPGIDFTSISGIADAYFQCVNDNGGIHGRPIEYLVETEQTDPQQVAQLAVKLIENDGVVALVGNTSLIDCAVNHQYYEEQGFNVIVAGVPAECFTTPNIAPVNMGPRISMVGIADYAVRNGAKKLVVVASNNPGVEYYNDGVVAYGKAKGIPTVALTQDVPIQDANSVALKLAQEAGEDGWVLLDFTAPEAIKILQAAASQGLIDATHWSCGGSCNDQSLAEALGPEWNGKFPINAELSSNAENADNQLYQRITEQYAPDIPLSSFGQLGYMAARYATEALLSLEPDEITPETANAAIRDLKNVPMDIICKPWYFGDLPFHQPVNTGRTIDVEDGQFVEVEGCVDVPDTDEALKETREAEQELGLNTGG